MQLEQHLYAILGYDPSPDIPPLPLGELVPSECPELAGKLLNGLALESGGAYPTLAEFDALPETIADKPALPRPGDPITESHLEGLSDTGRKRALSLITRINATKLQTHKTYTAWLRSILNRYGHDLRGYIRFMCDETFSEGFEGRFRSLSPDHRFFFASPQTAYLNEADRELHTYITGGSGHGKSTVLRQIVWHYQQMPDDTRPAVILIDPHGDLANECARFRTNRDGERLCYINAGLDLRFTPSLNPFELPGSARAEDAESYADQFIGAFKEAMRGESNFTPQMETLLKPCLITLMRSPANYSISDLLDFLGEDSRARQQLIAEAKRILDNPAQLAVFKDFDGQSYKVSRQSIRTKLGNLLQDTRFFHFLSGQPTFSLADEIDARRLIVFDLSGLKSAKAKQALGLFVMASIQNLALWRQNVPRNRRTPVHVIIDEAQDFVSDAMEKILTQARKFGIHATFAQQQVGQDMPTHLKRIVMGNTAIKITGNNEPSSLKAIATATQTDIADYQALRPLQFHVSVRGKGMPHVVRTRHLPASAYMSGDEWKALKAVQLERYYRLARIDEDDATDKTPEWPEAAQGDNSPALPDYNAARTPQSTPKPKTKPSGRKPARPIRL